jgi:hypothetical protein
VNPYTCGKPAKRRFYNPKAVSLSGMMMKFQMDSTWACDDCWAQFKAAVDRQASGA